MVINGFIDLQVNGVKGISFTSENITVDKVIEIAVTLRENWTCGFLATLVTEDKNVLEYCLNIIETASKKSDAVNLLGVHLEGPFISKEYGFRGIHPEQFVLEADIDWFEKMQNRFSNMIKIITLAPELKNIPEFTKRAIKTGTIVSMGHSNANYEQVCDAVESGLSMVTHLGNGCRQEIDRHNNPIFNVLARNEIRICAIADGFHLPESFLRMIFNSRKLQDIFIVSDAAPLACNPPGKYTFCGEDVVLHKNGLLCSVKDKNILAGSSFTMKECVKHLVNLDFLNIDEILNVCFYNQVRLLNVDLDRIPNLAISTNQIQNLKN